MSTFKKTILNTYDPTVAAPTDDQKIWSRLSKPVIVREFTEINYVHACPSSSFLVAVSTGYKVIIYNCRTGRALSTISRFNNTVYGATYKNDGRLFVVGSEDSKIRLFDCKNNDQLRVFYGHNGPVRRVKFVPGFPPRLVSFSDDKTVALWDIAAEQKILELNGHSDFVRAGCVGSSPDLVMSGSDDRSVRVWDARSGQCVFNFDHGSAHVNDVISYGGGNVLAAAGGNEVRVWDLSAGKLLSKLCRHHKDVTSLGLATAGSRLVSGSLDRHLKIYDTSTYEVVHTVECPASVLSFAVMPEDEGLVIGMISEGKGVISLQKKPFKKPLVSDQTASEPSNLTAKVIKDYQPVTLPPPDRLLLRSQHSKVLDVILRNSGIPATVAYLAELVRRGGIHSAVAGRSEPELRPLIRFLTKHYSNPSFKAVLHQVVNLLLDFYANKVTAGSPLQEHITQLHEMVCHDVALSKELVGLESCLALVYPAEDGYVSAASSSALVSQ
ncbi:U3 small nucleolar RNA-associated protein 15 C-terminal [Trinorchestia longiramus]|nr:U3 small nucleolar RNA-associated protein 15 C-terminal [Trinorchestia longiramus]